MALVSKKIICTMLNCDEDQLDELMRNRQDFPYTLFNEGTEDEEYGFNLEEVKALRIKPFKRKAAPKPVSDPFKEPEKPKPVAKPKPKPRTKPKPK